MIKILAALFMLIDHIGMIFFPENYLLRIIGRVSMPLFAYCIARGFYFSEQKGTTGRYARNLFLFAAVSQVPFTKCCRNAPCFSNGDIRQLLFC